MYEFIAIGDIIVDDFIRLEDERYKVENTEEGTVLSMPFPEKLPFEESTLVYAVGNAPNASVSAAKLGLKSALVASVGGDDQGKKTLEALKEKGVSTEFIKTQEGVKTNYSYVLWVGDDRSILRKHEEFAYSLPEMSVPKSIYFSSVGKHGNDFREDLAYYLEENTDINFIFQPGTNEINLGAKGLPRLYKRANITFCNIGEAEKILDIHTLGIKALLKKMHELGPEIVVITNGPKGAYAYDGDKIYFQPTYPDPKPPLERTGAGDSFSSTTAVALALGNDLSTSLQWGSINSMSVVQHIGAQEGLLSQKDIEEYLKKAPEEFETQVL